MSQSHDALKRILGDGAWYPLHVIHRRLEDETGEMRAETNTAARVRDLRKPKYGRLDIECRRRKGRKGYEYRWNQGPPRDAHEARSRTEATRRAEARAVRDERNENMRETLARLRGGA